MCAVRQHRGVLGLAGLAILRSVLPAKCNALLWTLTFPRLWPMAFGGPGSLAAGGALCVLWAASRSEVVVHIYLPTLLRCAGLCIYVKVALLGDL